MSYIGNHLPSVGHNQLYWQNWKNETQERVTGAVSASTATEEMPEHPSVPQRIISKGFSNGWFFWEFL